MKNNTELIKLATKYIGKGGQKFREFCGLSAGDPWCNAFVDYIYDEGGDAALLFDGKRPTYCPDSLKWCKDNLAQIPSYIAMASDPIYFDWELNGTPNHIGLVEKRISATAVQTIEGNTDGGKVARKKRTVKYIQGIFRPHFKPNKKLTKSKLAIDGDFGFKSIYMLQIMLQITADGILGQKTVKALQKKAGAKEDGQWGTATSKAVQKLTGAKQDGEFGPASVKALQKYINKICYPNDKAKLKSHRIEVDLTNQICTVYGIYSDGTEEPIMSEWVSTARKGRTTPVGTFKIQGWKGRKAKYRTALMSSGKAYAEYLVRFTGPKCMHTVPYKKRQTTGHVTKSEFNKLGTPRSAGCVRMPWIMAKYIYTKCPLGTPVKVFKGREGEYPMGVPKRYIATTDIDPTYKR